MDEVQTGEALSSLEGNEGWQIVKSMLEGARQQALERLANRKYTKNMNEVIWYQSMYQHANNTLMMVETKIARGQKAKDGQG